MGSAASAAKPDNGWQLGPGVSTVHWSQCVYIAVHCRGGSQPISGAKYNAMYGTHGAKHNAAEYTVLHCGGDLAAYLCRHVSLYGQLAQATGSDGDDDRILMDKIGLLE